MLKIMYVFWQTVLEVELELKASIHLTVNVFFRRCLG